MAALPSVAVILVAAGRGTRAGGDVPKAYRPIAGTPMIRLTLDAFAGHPRITFVQPVIHGADRALYDRATEGLSLLAPVEGGDTRQASVRAGLEALAAHAPDIVLVHDAARPFVPRELIDRAIAAAQACGAAVPGVPVVDTVKTVDAQNVIVATLERATMRAVQTPQAFGYAPLRAAHTRASDAGRDDFTDDAALMEWAGHPVSIFEGDTGNVKLTTGQDFDDAEMRRMAALGDIRTGSGFDIHQFAEGDHVTLGGVRIPHTHKLSGHSDADVVLHALVDAILGALAEGDIGVHFPPSDEQWRGASSDKFLTYAVDRVKARGGMVANVSIALVCEAPRVGPHRDAMRARMAEIIGIDVGRVGIQATTAEKLGAIGREEGIIAMATVTVRLPWGA